MSDDDVLDYMVMEAVAIKAKHEEEEEARKARRTKFKQDFSSLDQYR